MNKISLRMWYLAAGVCCVALLGFALFKQYSDYLDPCPLCIIQRLAYMWIGAFALLAAIHNPARKGQLAYSGLMLFGATFGAAVAARHVWLQHLPRDMVPECGPGLNYMLQNFPLSETLATVFWGSGSCAEVHWSFMGMSMPEWTLTWFVGLALATAFFTFRRRN